VELDEVGGETSENLVEPLRFSSSDSILLLR
jgi:hypothetical protein